MFSIMIGLEKFMLFIVLIVVFCFVVYGERTESNGIRRTQSTGDLDRINHRRKSPNAGNSNNFGSSCTLNYDFDYFVMAIQWPSSFCLEKRECNRKIIGQKKWLIHGLWPNRNQKFSLGRNRRQSLASTVSPGLESSEFKGLTFDDAHFCCGPRYNSSLFQGQLYRELLDKWPTLHPGGRHHSFWQHEWQKHGTCARKIRPLQNQLKYFETILGLYNRFNLNSVQFEHGQSYSLQEIHRKIEPKVGLFKVRIECSLVDNNSTESAANKSQQHLQHQTDVSNIDTRRNPSQHRQQQQQQSKRISIFAEVHICLDKQLRPINCPNRDDYQCKRLVLFP
ncbi:Ribonuclease Oy [Sarcoptes scabiei]|uniref:Ribonuclease Oy n=1 Tax=Sarcoptes scabiei TaxID=52283 RepID=A0A834RCD7_SARSC|nr:Ribonuclease Oy [Sarcoptes scabiei]